MPTMNVSITREMADFVEGELSSGNYVSASEVVRDALRAMRHDKELQEAKQLILRERLDEGIAQAERGEFSSRSVEDIARSVIGDVAR